MLTNDLFIKTDSYGPDPSSEDLNDPEFNAIWEAIKSWDINVPDVYQGYCGAQGNHVMAILKKLRRLKTEQAYDKAMRGI